MEHQDSQEARCLAPPCATCIRGPKHADCLKASIGACKVPSWVDYKEAAYQNFTELARKGESGLSVVIGLAAISDGSTASYYVLPEGAKELQDLIAFRDMNAQMGEIFRACYRYGQGHHSPRERDLKKIIFYAQAELDRLAKYVGYAAK